MFQVEMTCVYLPQSTLRFTQSSQSFLDKALRTLRFLENLASKKLACFAVKYAQSTSQLETLNLKPET